ncbi:MutH/Sau3AI family endonuclease [Metabacillus indicus]|uniref:MutH/Sau3AI family endonuclease n=1 Tax=Metabacillus indicus TaxID=246786 RepID=UPI002A059C1B|nr:MutH/Sau3AI family endonuclease [Metabacillus indicus]MDX8289123.1 MutH/Sau3AI family endonuclease [Metabacillus indicus]
MDKEEYLKEVQQQINIKFNEYLGLSFHDLARVVGINPDTLKSKLSLVKLVNELKKTQNFNESDLIFGEYIKSVSLKTVRLKHDGKPKESMSFEQIKFNELIKENWEDSKLRKKFLFTTFLFVVFEYNGKIERTDNLYFKGLFLWQMPQEIIDSDLNLVWKTTKRLLSDGLILEETEKNGKTVQINNLPGIKFNNVAHVRPKASNSSDKVLLPNGQIVTKQAFWLNALYIGEVLKEMPNTILRKQGKVFRDILDELNINKVKGKLNKPIYTYEEFIRVLNESIEDFEQRFFNDENVSALGYNIHSNLILRKDIVKPEIYFEQYILGQDYFINSLEPVNNSSQFIRKLSNLENSYDVVKVEENTYITIKKLSAAGIRKLDLLNFKKSVEEHVESGRFFSWKSIEKNGFQHDLIDLGFQDLFYESLLKRPGAFKYLKLNNITIFVKTIDDFSVTELFSFLLNDDTSISITEIEDRFLYSFDASISRSSIIYHTRNISLYYSEELDRLFIDRESYYKYIEYGV